MSRTSSTVPADADLSSSDPVQGESNTDRAYRILKIAIMEGGLPPGTVLSEKQLSTRLEMSRTPVHQAVVRLQDDGWLSISSRSGLRISGIDPHDMQNVYETLMALEGSAVERLAWRPESVSNDPVAQLISAQGACEEALAAADLAGWARADNVFHTLLLDLSGNPRLARAAAPLSEHAHRARMLTVKLRPWPEQSNADHIAIVAAIRDRDAPRARRALEEHRRRGIDVLVPIIESLLPSSAPFLSQR